MAFAAVSTADILGWFMRAKDIPTFPKSIWEKIGGRTATRIVKDAKSGVGADGEKFNKPYTAQYVIKKKAGKAAPKGVSQASRQTSFPDLTLTGMMLNSIKSRKATKTGVEIEFRDGLKVQGNAKNKRNIYGVSPKNEDLIMKDLGVYLGKQVDKYAKIPIEIKVG